MNYVPQHVQQIDRPRLAKLASVALPASWRFLSDESGQDLIEYVLLGALHSLAAITASKAWAPQSPPPITPSTAT